MSEKNRPQRYLLLDTNIIQHFGNPSLGNAIIEILKDAVTKKYGISISQISLMEMVDGASLETESQRLKVIKGLKHFKIKQDTLMVAAHLGSLYKQDGMTDKQQPEKGDKIIGATAILTSSIIYTTNGRDFPQPYFKEIGRHLLQYKKPDGTDVCIIGYYIEPDIQTTVNRYNYLIKANEGVKIVPTVEKTDSKG